MYKVLGALPYNGFKILITDQVYYIYDVQDSEGRVIYGPDRAPHTDQIAKKAINYFRKFGVWRDFNPGIGFRKIEPLNVYWGQKQVEEFDV